MGSRAPGASSHPYAFTEDITQNQLFIYLVYFMVPDTCKFELRNHIIFVSMFYIFILLIRWLEIGDI